VIAHTVAAPVPERARVLRVSHVGRHAAYADVGGFVVLVVGPGGPLLPNGVVLTAPPETGRLVLDGAHVWDPTLRLRETAFLGGAGAETPLERAVAARDPGLAAAAARQLIGRGPGSTPEGDDAIAVTAALVAAGPWDAALKAAWLGAVLPDDLRARTPALSATLLELATQGAIAEPLHAALHGGPLERLTRLGHTTGRAYAVHGAAALRGLGYGARHGARDQGDAAQAGAVDRHPPVARARGGRGRRPEVAAHRP
jgi:hypothetical protein